jgi:addiction module HigA family antidote
MGRDAADMLTQALDVEPDFWTRARVDYKIATKSHGEPRHPGDVLRWKFFVPSGLTLKKFADRIGIHFQALDNVLCGRRDIGTRMAVKLSAALGTKPDYWRNLRKKFGEYRYVFSDRSVTGYPQCAIIKGGYITLRHKKHTTTLRKFVFSVKNFEQLGSWNIDRVRDFITVQYGDQYNVMIRAYTNFHQILTAQARAVMGAYEQYYNCEIRDRPRA